MAGYLDFFTFHSSLLTLPLFQFPNLLQLEVGGREPTCRGRFACDALISGHTIENSVVRVVHLDVVDVDVTPAKALAVMSTKDSAFRSVCKLTDIIHQNRVIHRLRFLNSHLTAKRNCNGSHSQGTGLFSDHLTFWLTSQGFPNIASSKP